MWDGKIAHPSIGAGDREEKTRDKHINKEIVITFLQVEVLPASSIFDNFSCSPINPISFIFVSRFSGLDFITILSNKKWRWSYILNN